MKTNAESSITLSSTELKLVKSLQAKLNANSELEVIRRGLFLLKYETERESLSAEYRRASMATRGSSRELRELDRLAGEGLHDS